jgi:type VI secretion system secreted protein Hcp
METLFLEIDGIKGESTATQGKDQIELYSFAHGVSMPLTGNVSGDKRASGRCVHQDVTITKRWDISSPSFFQKCSGGEAVKSAKIHAFIADAVDGKMIEYLTIEIKDCLVTSVSIGGGGGDRPVETITINYNTITWTYTKQGHKAPGGSQGKAQTGWDLQANKKA